MRGGWLDGFAPQLFGGSRGNALFVFALPEETLTSISETKAPAD